MSHSENPALHHLVFCALVALSFEQQTAGINGRIADNLFLLRWLTKAQKQKRFPKSIAEDIAWLIREGRKPVAQCHLKETLNAVWQGQHSDIDIKSPLRRLHNAVEALQAQGWKNLLLTEEEWSGQDLTFYAGNSDTLYMTKPALEAAFDEQGKQLTPLDIRVVGDLSVLQRCFGTYSLSLEPLAKTVAYGVLRLVP